MTVTLVRRSCAQPTFLSLLHTGGCNVHMVAAALAGVQAGQGLVYTCVYASAILPCSRTLVPLKKASVAFLTKCWLIGLTGLHRRAYYAPRTSCNRWRVHNLFWVTATSKLSVCIHWSCDHYIIQNPGFDFSGANISGNYSGGGPRFDDSWPTWSKLFSKHSTVQSRVSQWVISGK